MITKEERGYLRDLAKRQLEIANLPVMAERATLWKAHNDCRGVRPMIYADMDAQCMDEMLPAPRCEGFACQIERQLLCTIVKHELVDCDTVVPPEFTIPWHIHVEEFGIRNTVKHAQDGRGGALGYAVDYTFRTPQEALCQLQPASCAVDRQGTAEHRQRVEEVLGDILPVRVENSFVRWFPMLTYKIVTLMSMENLLLSIYDQPDQLDQLMEFLANNTLRVLRWQEAEGLLTLNNGNDYAGSGSLGFTGELPQAGFTEGGNVRLKDIWINTNSQETVGVSPSAFREHFYPFYRKLAQAAGLVYYGCCEPVHHLWAGCLENLPNLRKVSISKWCDEPAMGEALRGKRIVYCRKPDPNFIGVGNALDEGAFEAHITKTLQAARGCELEFSFRDIYTQCGDPTKLGRAIRILRRLTEDFHG